VTEDDELELRPSPADEPDPLDRVLIQRPGDLFPSVDLDRRGMTGEPADSDSAPLFPNAIAAITAPETTPTADRAAPIGARARAFAADALLCVLVSAGAFLGAAASVRRSPSAGSWIWCALFALQVSFFLCIPSLVLFGKTPGMALSDLTAEREDGEKPPVPFALRRWIAGILTILLAGLPLFTIVFDRRRRTPADLSSGWPLRLLPESLR
jgi:uncharacterized RDD family membrane protein YckC